MPLDITISPLYRVGGQEQASLPGLMAAVPPRKAAHGREQDRLLVYLSLSGKGVLSGGDCVQAASRAAVAFYATPGTITSALRTAAESINTYLHSRNLSSREPGSFTVGVLALGVVREQQFTLLTSGPMHTYVLAAAGVRHIHDTLSGRGLGLSETAPYHFSQVNLEYNDRLVLCSNPPSLWESALRDASPASLEATRRRLRALVTDNVNAVLVQGTEGSGVMTIQRFPPGGNPASFPPTAYTEGHASAILNPIDTQTAQRTLYGGRQRESSPTDSLFSGPSAYAIPPQRKDEFPAANPDKTPGLGTTQPWPTARGTSPGKPELPRSQGAIKRQRQAAKFVAGAIQSSRQAAGFAGQGIRSLLPRLLPGSNQDPWSISTPTMIFIAMLVPLLVVTVASAVYFRYGRSVQYEQYLVQAQESRTQALALTDPVAKREAWQRELFYLDKAESVNEIGETRRLRSAAQQSLDQLLGIVRLQFQPVLGRSLGVQVSRLAADENDLYLLDSQRGEVLHVSLENTGFAVDEQFNCAPGSYGGYSVGALVDILAMPAANTINATLVGVDAAGNLLYCAPDELAKAIPLPPPDTNWGRVKAFTMDGGNLYVLDAQAHAVWVYFGKDGTFLDRPYFFFGSQIPELEDAIDLAVSPDDLYVLHSDGHVSTCSYSRIEAVPTRCVDPAVLINPFPAYADIDLFSEAHFTQLLLSPAPEAALLLLDSDGQGMFRFAPRSLELQGQFRAVATGAGSLPQGELTAMAVSPNHVVYIAMEDRLYFAADSP